MGDYCSSSFDPCNIITEMLSPIIDEELREIVQELMEKEDKTEYKLEICGRSVAGDNYMGDIIFFKILTENDETIHDLVMKTAKRSEELRNSFPMEHAYNREIVMYTRVFPEFQKFLADVKADFKLDFVPKIYWSTADQKRETLIFKNLKSDGYKLRDRKIPWNMEHSLFAMKHYARFHATSLAFKDQRPELYMELTKNMLDVYKELSKAVDIKKLYSKPFEKIMELFKKNGREDLITKYEGFLEETVPLIKGQIDDDDKIVITHGDCWNNNFMFKYKDNNETVPYKMCFLDFQLSSLGTPITDLSYNIFTTCDKSCLNHLDLILEIYYNTLSETLKSLGSNPDILFPRKKFDDQWKKYSKFGVVLASVLIRILLTSSEDAPDLAKTVEEGKALEDSFGADLKDEDEYNRRIMDVFIFYGDRFVN